MKNKPFNPPSPRIRAVKPKPSTKKQCREDYEQAKVVCAANAGEIDKFLKPNFE